MYKKLFIFFIPFVLSVFFMPPTYAENHTLYANKHGQKSKELIAPYITEVNEIIKNVLKRQSQPDIQALKKKAIATAKRQCPLQKKIILGDKKDKKGKKDKKVNIGRLPIIVFVSFSMPKESIKGWITQAQKVDASVYIRGLVNNSFKDTTKAVGGLVQNQHGQQTQSGGLLIDPTLFKKYSITQVPAVVVVQGDSFDVIYGDVTLDYALGKISRAQESKQGKNKNRIRLLKTIKKLRSMNIDKGKTNV